MYQVNVSTVAENFATPPSEMDRLVQELFKKNGYEIVRYSSDTFDTPKKSEGHNVSKVKEEGR